jgi:3-dehydroquinate dehydratase/shikimate dehydrogenase
MLCISIAQESRRLALVDMLNAARQCDLLELRLDRFGKAPDVNELLTAKPKPVIVTCRRREDGGQWEGSESERLTLLRQCIINKADYVEIEHDVADEIRPFPPSKRVISYTNLDETPTDIGIIYAKLQKKKPDIIKLTTLARTPEEAWPLVQILAKPALPTVVAGLGKAGVMLSVLGRKIGAPWAYASLERCMEAYPGQPTVHDLNNVYHYPAITKGTRLVGVTGFGRLEYATAGILNAGLAHLELPARCLPLAVGGIRNFRKVMDAVKLASVVIDAENRGPLAEVATDLETAASHAEAVDLLVHQDERWQGYNLLCRASLAVLESTLKARSNNERPLEGRTVMLSGVHANTRALAYALGKRGAACVISSRDKENAHRLAQQFNCRYVQFEAMYSTLHDVLIVCSDEQDIKARLRTPDAGIHAGYLKPGMTVMDLTSLPIRSQLIRDAELRDCIIVDPRQIVVDQAVMQLKLITGREVPRSVPEQALQAILDPDE